MTQEPSHTDSIAPHIARVIDECGAVVMMELDADRVEELIQRLGAALDAALGDEFTEVTVRMVLGSACTTAAKAIDHFVAALQLPYGATQGWTEFREALADRSAKAECVVVTDASQLLEYEDYDLWQDLVDNLHHDQRSGCLYRGWNTLVLVDTPHRWNEWAFRSHTAAER
ncbi:hypothetical protein [Actinomadura algeriensis]|uniref:Barstar (barnase inhibitor) domain-containing protein n=1 Tax=Actinomadura algeriensis TaxID=1679523 RepID=A0ABR9JSX8_9ACTN|nr:hypothetical protein [Actinomadura algeriensis]MBE1533672.1 hypothetical protein [Actinomadura algeriensis]